MSKKKKNGEVYHLNRNKVVGPMTKFANLPVSPEAQQQGVVAMLKNNRYGVILKKFASAAFATPAPDGKSMAHMEIIHMVIVRNDRKNIEIPWREKQQIKMELLSPECDALEMFPAEDRDMHDIADYQTHIWAFPPGFTFPLGLFPEGYAEKRRAEVLKELTVSKEELELYTIEDKGILQVFASEAEAQRMYREAENEMPQGKVVRIGDVGADHGEVWSDAAKAKLANVLSKARQFDELDGKESEPDAVTVDLNGPKSSEDDVENEEGITESPKGDEENVMMSEYMKTGVKQMADRQVDMVKKAVETLEKKMEDQDKKEEEDRESEEQAKDELDKMREDLRKERLH